LKQSTKDGKNFVELLKGKGIITGIKVDKGTIALQGGLPNETYTVGLDDLHKRAA